jgi:hypothetical protein
MSRVWIYQSNRFLSEAEVSEISVLTQQFVELWTAHGSALTGKVILSDNLFLILEVDEEVAGVTGCSIDKSVHFIKGLGEKFGVDFFDRMRISYFDDDGKLQLASRDEFQALVNSGAVHRETVVYNNLIQTSEELTSKWKIPFSQSWHSKIF